VKALEQAGLQEKVKVIIGGAPVSQTFAEQTQADAYGAFPVNSTRTAADDRIHSDSEKQSDEVRGAAFLYQILVREEQRGQGNGKD
jgi:hypothetical protein